MKSRLTNYLQQSTHFKVEMSSPKEMVQLFQNNK